MALGICMELLVRMMLTGVKIMFVDHLFWTLFFLAAGVMIRNSILAFGALEFGLKVVGLLIGWFWTTAWATTGGLFLPAMIAAALSAAYFSVLIGEMWMILILGARTIIILRVIAAPFYFVFGMIWGLLPIPLPLGGGLAILFQDKRIALIGTLVPFGIFILFVFFQGIFGTEILCSIANYGLKALT